VGFTKRSNNQISAVDVMLGWFYGLALGAERFEHLTRYRRDRLLGELLGMKRFASPRHDPAAVFKIQLSKGD
jgi:hypothetical protein